MALSMQPVLNIIWQLKDSSSCDSSEVATRQILSARVLSDLRHYLSLFRNSSSTDGLSISRSRSSQGCPGLLPDF